MDSDYVDQLEQFVPLVCANCETHPVGLYDPSPQHVRALNIVCMQALRQHLALAHRVSFTLRHLEQMMNVTLDTLAQPAPDMDMADGSGDVIEGSQPWDPPHIRSSGKTPTSYPSMNLWCMVSAITTDLACARGICTLLEFEVAITTMLQ